MKTSLIGLYTILTLAFVSIQAVADEEPSPPDAPKFEISALSNAGLILTKDVSVGFLMGGVAYELIPGLQLGVSGAYFRVGYKDSNVWGLAALVGPIVNFPFQADIRDAFYASFKYGGGVAGGTDISSKSDSSRGAYSISVGKRFQFTQHLSYTPEVGVFKVLDSKNDIDPVYRIIPLGLSLFF